MESKIAQRQWDVIRAVCYMLRKSVSKRKLMLEVHNLLQRGKITGKAIANLITLHPHHHHHHHHGHNNFNYDIGGGADKDRFILDPNNSFYFPQGIEFSCSSTPANPSFSKKRINRRRHRNHDYLYNLDAAAIAEAFEVMSLEGSDSESVVASPFALNLSVMKRVRSVRITDSPFPIKEQEDEYDVSRVDRAAEEFIKRFYEQLQRQEIARN